MTDILNLPYLRVISCLDKSEHYIITASGTLEPSACGYCGLSGFYGHGSQRQSYMDLPMDGKHVVIEIDRRRFRCKSCGKTMFEPLPDMDGKRQATSRLIQHIEKHSLVETFSSLSREIGVDDKTVRFIFDDYVARRQDELHFKTPEILGIGEIKIIGDSRVMLTNVDKLALFDLLQSRKKAALLEYFDAMPDKQSVTTLIMDMWNPYRQAGKKMFPGRLIVVDKSHVLRKLNEGMERVRRQIRKSADDKTKFKLKDERSLLLKRKCHLKEEESVKVQRWFAMFPKLGIAYEAKEHFYNIYSQPTRAAAECSAKKWVSNLDPEIEKPFRVLRVALNDWHEEIFNYFDYQVDNTYTESIDNINRFISRMGRGYSFGALRARLLFEDQIIKGEKSDGDKSEETVVNYGADLLTLARLLEEGHFS